MSGPVPSAALPLHVLDRDDMKDALSHHDFGAVFSLARKWAGISYAKISESTGIKPHSRSILGQHQLAIDGFRSALAEIPTSFLRDRGVYVAWEALAHAPNPKAIVDLQAAVSLGTQALGIAARTGSRRITASLIELSVSIAHRSSDDVQEFQCQLNAVTSA